jgi:methionyl-tRNA formyltransferase
MKVLVLCNDRMALPALNKLLLSGRVAGVGMSARPNETQAIVKMLCAKANVPFRLFNKSTFAADLQQWIKALACDAVLVKTFPWKIPPALLEIPRLGFINFHYAPLPRFRGANPLFWMIKNGIAETGVTVHRMTPEFDDGPILLTSKLPIMPGATMGMVCTQLAYSGVELTGKLLQLLDAGIVEGATQDATAAEWYGRPTPQDLFIQWAAMDAEVVKRLASACNPWNKGAAANLNGWMVGISYATVLPPLQQPATPGTILAADEINGLLIACAGNTLLRADVVYVEEGFMPGFALANFGIKAGMKFS